MSYWHVNQKNLTTVIPRCNCIFCSYFVQGCAENAISNLFSIGRATYLIMKNNKKSTHALALCAGVDVNASPAEQPCKRPVKWYRTPRYLTGCISVCWTNARILPFLLCLPIQLTSANRHHCVSGPSSVFPLSVLIFTRFRGSAQSHDYLGYECSINWLNWSRWRISVGCWLIHLRY